MSAKRVKLQSNVRQFSRDSIDRFGDDLTEELLSYLRFEDKIRFECLSKQCRRLIFNKQFVLKVHSFKKDDNCLNELVDKKLGYRFKRAKRCEVNKTGFVSVLKKCPNLRQLYLYVYIDGEVLQMIVQYCPRVTDLELEPICMHTKKFLDFRQKVGPNLKSLKLDTFMMLFNDNAKENLKKFLEMCPNLKKIAMDGDQDLMIRDDKEFLAKVDTFEDISIYSRDNYRNQLKILTEKYAKSLKKLEINIITTDMNETQLKTCLQQISCFDNLRSLELKIERSDANIDTIDQSIALLVRKCSQLKTFELVIHNSSLISEHFLSSLSELKSIEKLIVDFKRVTKNIGDIDCLRQCSQLKTLIITHDRLNEEFFANIATILPKLQLLDIRTNENIGDAFLTSLHSMLSLQQIIVNKKRFFYFHKYLENSDKSKMKLFGDYCGKIVHKIPVDNFVARLRSFRKF